MERKREYGALPRNFQNIQSPIQSNVNSFLEPRDQSSFSKVSRFAKSAQSGEMQCEKKSIKGLNCLKGVVRGIRLGSECLHFCNVHRQQTISNLLKVLGSAQLQTEPAYDYKLYNIELVFANTAFMTIKIDEKNNAEVNFGASDGDVSRNFIGKFRPDLLDEEITFESGKARDFVGFDSEGNWTIYPIDSELVELKYSYGAPLTEMVQLQSATGFVNGEPIALNLDMFQFVGTGFDCTVFLD